LVKMQDECVGGEGRGDGVRRVEGGQSTLRYWSRPFPHRTCWRRGVAVEAVVVRGEGVKCERREEEEEGGS
jgi:hypothetical protein